MQYTIGSFNMRRFGKNAKKDFEKIADIILGEGLDIVALQEIFSEGKGVERLLGECVKYQLYDWDYCWAAPHESSDTEKERNNEQNDTRGEGYAYLWNKRRFKLLEYTRHNNSVF